MIRNKFNLKLRNQTHLKHFVLPFLLFRVPLPLIKKGTVLKTFGEAPFLTPSAPLQSGLGVIQREFNKKLRIMN